jgi:hypothetical protein
LGDQVLPEKLSMRELRFQVDVPGFRSESITLVTTLLGDEAYPKEDLAELFFARWQIELRLRDMKTIVDKSIGLDSSHRKDIEKKNLLELPEQKPSG